MKKILGIDLGISFVGFCLIDNVDHKIIKSGVHIFSPAEDPKTGASLALPRRMKRTLRRVILRRCQRNRQLKEFLTKIEFKELELLSHRGPIAPWGLRDMALSRLLSDLELSRCLLHISNHRGFKSMRKSIRDEQDIDGKMLQGISDLQKKFQESGKKTIGQYINILSKKRNNPGEYHLTATREVLEEEVRVILKTQHSLGNEKLTEKVQKAIFDIIFYQRPLQSVFDQVGDCSIFPQEKRAAKHAFSSELFVFFSRLNNLKIKNFYGDTWKVTSDMREDLLKKCLLTKKVTFSSIRKLWNLPEDYLFNLVNYDFKDIPKNITTAEKNLEFASFSGYHTIQKALEKFPDLWEIIKNDHSKLDEILTILSFEFCLDNIKQKFYEDLKLPLEVSHELSKSPKLSKTINLSLRAVYELLPFLREGMRYDEACNILGYDIFQSANKKLNKLPELEKTNNPVVDRACSQARKVINAIIQRYGLPDALHIELGYELEKSRKERGNIAREQKKNFETKQSLLIESIEFFGYEPSSTERIKYRLWKEQRGLCVYSGKYIEPDVLKDHTGTKINHILPFSRSYDDSFANKVLCSTSENQKKGNQTPFEYIGDKEDLWSVLESIANSLPYPKRRRLLLKNFEQLENDYKSRNLNDMRFASRHLKNHIQQNLDIKKVFTINGKITSFLRNSWQIQKILSESDTDRVVDSAVIACATESMVKKIISWNKHESQMPYPPEPWESFKEDLEEAKSQVFISRMARRNIKGCAHHETIKSVKESDGNLKIIKRIPILEVNLQILKKIVDPDTNKNLFDILEKRLKEHDNDPKKAFASDVHMKKNDGTMGPLIKGIRIYDSAKSGIRVNNGIANNGDMIRVDVFSKLNKNTDRPEFYLCPLYVADTALKFTPNYLCASGKDQKDWPLIDESYLFCFSLFKNDLVKLRKKDGTEIIGYFNSMHRSHASIAITIHDNSEIISGIGVKSLLEFEKYSVNYFGEIFKIKGEKRLELANNKYTERRKIKYKK